MAAFLNTCRFTPTLGGLTDFVVSAAVLGMKTPATASAVNGRVYKWRAESANLTQWEEFEGAYTSGTTTVARTTILASSTGAKVNFTTAPEVFCVALKEDLLSVEEANSFTAGQRAQARANISVGLKGRLFGLTLSTAGSSATFGVAAGEAADSTGVDLMALASAYTKTTAAWALGTAAGSLDTGAIANSTWYHVHLIKRPDTGVVDALVSLSATAPTLPTNYTLFRRIGSMKTNGSAQWTKFIQDGDNFTWDAPVNDVSNTNPGAAAVTRTLTVPTGVRVEATIAGYVQGTTGADSSGAVYVSDLSVADTAAGQFAFTFMQYDAAAAGNVASGSWARVFTNTSAQVRTRLAISTAGTLLTMDTIGWRDRCGKDA